MVVKFVEITLFRATCATVSHHTLGAVRLKTACCSFAFLTLMDNILVEPLKLLTFEGPFVESSTIKRDYGVKFVVNAAVAAPVAEVVVRLLVLDHRVALKSCLVVSAVKQRTKVILSAILYLRVCNTHCNLRAYLSL